MSIISKRLADMGLSMPELTPGKALFQPYVISGNHVYISGQLPAGFGDLSKHVGQVGRDVEIDFAKKVAKLCGLNILYQINQACGGNLERVKKCVKITVFVNSSPTFTQQPAIANEISQLFLDVFGDEKGAHARSAIGVSQLPFGVAVEAEAIFEI